jgi:hypothetical protein
LENHSIVNIYFFKPQTPKFDISLLKTYIATEATVITEGKVDRIKIIKHFNLKHRSSENPRGMATGISA